MLENTEGASKNEQSRETGNKTRKSKTKTQHNMCWTPLCVNKNTTQYVLDTTMRKQKHNTICVGHHYA